MDKNTNNKKNPWFRYLLLILLFCIIVFSFPIMIVFSVERDQNTKSTPSPTPFPVTVDPRRKIITENNAVNSFLQGSGTSSPLEASVTSAFSAIWDNIKLALTNLAETPWYHNVASLAGINGHLVTITPGMRKEQVASTFANTLNWDKNEKTEFLNTNGSSSLTLQEGSFFPDTYYVNNDMTPADVQKIISKNFAENVLIHYGTSTAQLVPIEQALNIASIIQRETIGNKDVRLISGILWNRLFNDMKLQVDATLQYAKASKTSNGDWWPDVKPSDKYIKSPYNTYQHAGLPPTPISSPSVGAILAALNPISTPCLYYFSDKSGEFHCSQNYKDHVNLLKKYY